MLRAGQDRFVLKYERNREQHFKLLIQRGQQKLARSTSVTPQRRNHHVSVEHVRSCHAFYDIACNITKSSDFELIFAAVQKAAGTRVDIPHEWQENARFLRVTIAGSPESLTTQLSPTIVL
jgi:hypothetical protein